MLHPGFCFDASRLHALAVGGLFRQRVESVLAGRSFRGQRQGCIHFAMISD
jgi:hypothetical protein